MTVFNKKQLEAIESKQDFTKRHIVLLVDDESPSLLNLADLLSDYYDILSAQSGLEALTLIQAMEAPENIHMIISDQRMPQMTGVEFLEQTLSIIPRTIRIILTGFAEVESVIDSINRSQIYRFILKPFDQHDMLLTVKRALEAYDLETQLRHSQKMEAIGTLAAGIAHDFNNILQSMFLSLQLSSRSLPTESPIKENLDLALTAGYRARDLIHQILTFSRQDTETLLPVHLSEILEEALQMMRATIPKTIEILEYIDPTCSPILGSSTQLHQVIINLCTNAAYAMRDIGGKLELRLEPVELDEPQSTSLQLKTGSYLYLQVSDTGVGIAPEIQQQIFDPFFSTKPIGDGSGIGLSVVKRIVQEHSGAILLQSEPGQGSTFQLYFPITRYSHQMEVPVIDFHPDTQRTILFVDDESNVVELGKAALEMEGYHVIPFTNSEEALESFRRNPDQFDIVLTDQIMPQMTGLQFGERLIEIRPDIPIILATGYSELKEKKTDQSLLVKAQLIKPFDLDELVKVISSVLEQTEQKS